MYKAAPLVGGARRPYASPASLLELQLLIETGRVRLRTASRDALASDGRWTIDDPPAVTWFQQAWGLSWTRDPFDRLLVAHARLRGWRLATADTHLLDQLDPSETLVL